MRRRLILLIATAVACAAPTRYRPPARVSPWLSADPRRCLIPRDLAEDIDAMARRCAEQFVLDNGYTKELADDSTRWVREPADPVAWPAILARRTRTLEPRATTAQCTRRGCVVLFRVRRPAVGCAFRVVHMSQVFTDLEMAPVGIRDVRCYERRA